MEELSRRVVFVGGTSFSGSTMLDMMLSNDPEGFSCGEVEALFFPFRPHHVAPECGCADECCDIWPALRKLGVNNLYRNLFSRFPCVRFIVDSSKSPLWIRARAGRLRQQGIEVRHILIWKTPEEFRHSLEKRGMEKGWRRAWTNYHRQYFTFVDSWRAVPYSDLVSDPDVFRSVCDWLGIPWFAGKEQYWTRRPHTLFGNTSAKIHLYGAESQAYHRSRDELVATISGFEKRGGETYRTITHSGVRVEESAGDGELRKILHALREGDVRNARNAAAIERLRLRMPSVYRLYRGARRYAGSLPYRAAAKWAD